MKKKESGSKTPSCEAGGKEFAVYFSERSNGWFVCGACGTHLPIQDAGEKFLLPRHDVPAELHEYRKRLDKDAKRNLHA